MSHEIPSGNYEQNNERRIDLSTEEWTERLANAPVYKKTALVHIRPAVPGELITTILANGNKETSNIAGEQDVVITNPSGEKQIVRLEKAVQRYDLTDVPGLFLAKGMVRAIGNPYDQPIAIRAPWGSEQYGDAECKIATLYDPSNPDTVSMDRYIIGKDEFIKTYEEHTAGSTVPDISPLVLQAVEEYNTRPELPALKLFPYLGGTALYLAN